MQPTSFVHFQDGQIWSSTNDGMELLGHFLLTQVGTKGDFFVDFLRDSNDREVSAGPYFVQTVGNKVIIEHLEHERVFPFETTKARMLDLVKAWEGFCKSDASSACKIGGAPLMLVRSVDGDTFKFETHN